MKHGPVQLKVWTYKSRFVVELDENEIRGNKKETGEVLFKTDAVPSVVSGGWKFTKF